MKKKGFTLVELLAIIVIIGILALIATPIILGVLEKTKKNAFEETVKGLIKTVDIDKDRQGYKPTNYKVIDGNLFDGKNKKIETNGGTNENGVLSTNISGEISAAINNGKWCAIKNYYDNKVTITNYNGEDCEVITTVTLPTYRVTPSGDVWAKSKTVTITYPPRQTGYIYDYSVNGGSSWIKVDSGTTANYTFTVDGDLIARIYDGSTYFYGSTL